MMKGPEVAVVVVSVIVTVISLALVLAKLYVRLRIQRNAGLDDLFIGVAMLSSLGMLAMTMLEIRDGLGEHVYNLEPSDIERVLKDLYGCIICYNLTLNLTKVSILLQYLRLFAVTRMRYIVYATIVVCSLHLIQTVTMAIVPCNPPSAFWTGNGYCVKKEVVWLFNATMNMVTDMWILILPMPILWKLKMEVKQKIGLMVTMALGLFVSVISITRLRSVIVTASSKDITADNLSTAIWSLVEANVAVMCASLPTLRAFIAKISAICYGTVRGSSANRSMAGTQAKTNLHPTAISRHQATIRRPDDDLEASDLDDDEIEVAGDPEKSPVPASSNNSTSILRNEAGSEAELVDEQGSEVLCLPPARGDRKDSFGYLD